MINKSSRLKWGALGVGIAFALLVLFLYGASGWQIAHAQPQTTFTVTNTNNGGAGSLRQAINLANSTPGDDLIVADMPGCTPATPCVITLLSELPTITETVTISGTGATSLIIDAGGNYRALSIEDVVVTLADLTIRNGYTPGNGAGIRTMGELFLYRVHLLDNVAGGAGGGAYAEDLMEVYDSWVEGNAAEGHGGGLYSEDSLTLQNTSVIINTSEGDGGGTYSLNDTTLLGGNFEGNLSIGSGGGAYVSNMAVVTGTLFLSNTNTTYGGGGGLMAENAVVYNAWFEANTAETGGGLYAGNTLHLENTTFLRNETQSDNGGGAYAGGDVTVIGGRFEENSTGGSGDGGGLFVGGSSASVTGTVFLNNTSGSEGAGSSGGGLFTYGNAWIENSWFENNFSDMDGGGVRAAGTLDLTNTTFINNTAGDGGGAYSEGVTNARESLFDSNVSMDGGGLYVGASATLTDTVFSGNLAEYGGGVYVYGDVTITGGVFEQNGSTLAGGGGYFDGNAHLSGTSFLNNNAGTDGGGLYVASAMLTGTTFLTNTAEEAGGGIFGVMIHVSDGEFFGNASDYGGGIYSFNDLDLINVYLAHNTATEYGGGAYGIKYIYISGSHFDQNTSEFNGGGLAGLPDVEGIGEAEIVDSLFTQNNATGAGGAVVLSSPLGASIYSMIVESSTFFDNHADVGGGIYYTLDDGQIVNCLFAGNTATTDGSALGLYTFDSVGILHSTVVGDPQNLVSGIRFHNGFLDIQNTIFTQHDPAILNINGTLEQDYNLFYENTTNINGAFTGGSNTVNSDPHFLAPLQDNYHLGAESAALDEGTNVGVNVDADGDPRPYGPGFDIGYDEASAISGLTILYSPTPTITVGSAATFTATVTSGSGILYTWDFGDDSPEQTGNPVTHIYTAPGLYTVTLTATNALGSVTTSVEIEVVESKIPPAQHQVFLPVIVR